MVRVLSVCSHNRTRSVLTGALLSKHASKLGIDLHIETAGFAEEGQPPTARVADVLRSMRLDVDRYASRRVTADAVRSADVIVTAERRHVVEIAGAWPQALPKTMTLPEIVHRADALARRGGPPIPALDEWLAKLNEGRPTALDYLDATDVGEIDDPTGDGPAGFRQCFERIDTLTNGLALHLAVLGDVHARQEVRR